MIRKECSSSASAFFFETHVDWRRSSEEEYINFQTSNQHANIILFLHDTDGFDPDIERLCALNWEGEDVSETLPVELQHQGLKGYKSVVFNAAGTMLYVLTAHPLTVHLFPIQNHAILSKSSEVLLDVPTYPFGYGGYVSFHDLHVYEKMLFLVISQTLFMVDLSSAAETTSLGDVLRRQPVWVVHASGYIHSVVCLRSNLVIFSCVCDPHLYAVSPLLSS